MTVEKGDVRDITLRYLPRFMVKRPHHLLTAALIAPITVQMERALALIVMDIRRSRTRAAEEWDRTMHSIPTTEKLGILHCEYDIQNQGFIVALRLDNYIVQQTIPERDLCQK